MYNIVVNLTEIPPIWFQSLLRPEGISTINNASERDVFLFIFGEMKDLEVPINEIVESRYYKLRLVNLESENETEVNFPSKCVKVVVGYYDNRTPTSITTLIQKTLQQSFTFNVLQRHLTNNDPLKGLQTQYENFEEFEQFLIEHENGGFIFPELPTN